MKTRKKVVLLEDDPFYQVKIERMLSESEYDLNKTFSSTEGVFDYIKDHKVDVFISDIIIDGKPLGIELIEQINLLGIPIICISNFPDKAYFKRLKHRLISYLIKPFHQITLLSTLQTAVGYPDSVFDKKNFDNPYIYLNGIGGRKEKVTTKHIIYATVDGNYSFVNTKNQKYAIKSSLNKFIKSLPDNTLIRVHHKYAINPNWIESFDMKMVALGNGLKLKISDSFREEAISKIKANASN